MNSRSRSRRTSLGFSLGNAYSSGLSSSYGAGLASSTYTSGYGFSNTLSPSYTGYSSYLTRGTPSYTTASTGYSAGKDYTSSVGTSTRYSSSSTYTSPVTTTAKRYTGAKTDSDLTAGSERASSTGWRSKSIETSGNGYRDRSISREPSCTHEFSYRTGVSREKSSGRDFMRENSLARDFSSSRDYARAGSIGPDSVPHPPPRTKNLHTSNLKLPVYDSSSRFSNATQSMNKPMSRSNSFHDLRDITSPSTPRIRNRHQTLAFGVSELDLERAKSTLNITSRGSMSDLRGASWRGSNRDLPGNPSGASFNLSNGYSKNNLDLGYSSQPVSRSDSVVVSIFYIYLGFL